MKKILFAMLFAVGLVGCSSNDKNEDLKLQSSSTYNSSDFIINGKLYVIQIKENGHNFTDITVHPKILPIKMIGPLRKDEILSNIKMLISKYKIFTKGSFQLNDVYVLQKGTIVKIRIEFTGKNEDGVAVVGNFEDLFHVEGSGKLIMYDID